MSSFASEHTATGKNSKFVVVLFRYEIAYFHPSSHIRFISTNNKTMGLSLNFSVSFTDFGSLHFHTGIPIDGAIGSSLGSTFVGQLIQRQNIHMDHGIFGSPDLDQSGRFSAWLQSKLVVPLLTSFTRGEKQKAKTKEKLKIFFEMSDETADKFMACFEKFKPESIRNEYYTDLLTWLEDDIHVENTRVHFIYANKMGEKYLKRYKKYFRDPEIREFDMQHEQWLFGGEEYAVPVLNAIDEFMGIEGVRLLKEKQNQMNI